MIINTFRATGTGPRSNPYPAARQRPAIDPLLRRHITVEPAEIQPAEPEPAEPTDDPVDAHASTTAPADRPPLWQRTLSMLFTLAVVALIVFLWPARFGGSTRLVIVSGDSMEPTYDFGDVIVTRASGTPDVGDIVVFSVPDGEAAGILVIHRVVDIDAQGRYQTQGDNRDTADSWELTADDIVGTPLVRIPKGGYVVWYLHQWFVIAILVGLLAIFLLWPTADESEEELAVAADPPGESGERPAIAADVALPAVAASETRVDPVVRVIELRDDTTPLTRPELWSDQPIAAEVMDDAIAWLDEQLNSIARTPSS